MFRFKLDSTVGGLLIRHMAVIGAYYLALSREFRRPRVTLALSRHQVGTKSGTKSALSQALSRQNVAKN